MPRKTRSQDEQCSTMIIGLDFGTTYSGIAFAHSSRPNDIKVVSNWVDGRNTNKGKCPTLITYDGDRVASWGYGASQDPNAIKWFKLLLLKLQDIPADVKASEELRSAHKRVTEAGKQPIELVADYLRQLWALAYEKMMKSYSQALVEGSHFHVVLSVPAIWPDYAKEMMLEAARWAGICDDRPTRPPGDTILNLISEPEAAALATMMDNFDDKTTADGAHIGQPGDCFVVCDAGGGTADLITYRIKSVDPWRIEECVRGDGKLCGAVILDKAFRITLQSKLTLKVWQQIHDNANVFDMQWEKVIKREYRASMEEQSVTIPLSGSNTLPRDWDPVVVLSKTELQGIFGPMTRSIVGLVQKQIGAIPRRAKVKDQPAKYVVLVGGLGSSHHLYECLKAKFNRESHGPEVLQSEGDLPWTAICRGAVVHGFNQRKLHGHAVKGAPNFDVQSRIARRSYGTICTFEEWNPREHLNQDRRYCPIEDRYVADYQMSWFVRAGEHIGEGEIKLCAFSQALEAPDDLADGITTELVYSDTLPPPKRCDVSVKKLCEVHWDRVPAFEDLPERLSDAGRDLRDISYDVEMVFKGASAHFGIWHKEEKVASKNVLVDFQASGTTARKAVDE